LTQVLSTIEGARERTLDLPAPTAFVMDAIPWGRVDELFTPAYWAAQAWLRQGTWETHRLGSSFREEVAACLLGGYGISAEIALAAFYHLRDQGLLRQDAPDGPTLFASLSQPLYTDEGPVHYRFARQKSGYLTYALAQCDDDRLAEFTDTQLRYWLLQLPGIGPKTASWITRNWRGSSEVAIIDTHVLYAGRLVGLFQVTHSITAEYFVLEDRFLEFAMALGTDAAGLDALMWQQIKAFRSPGKRRPAESLAQLRLPWEESERGRER
jgi:N-glycosylase/DNA lyase